MADNIVNTIQERIRREMNEQADIAATGGCLSAETADMVALKYAEVTGTIKGLAIAERCILDILNEREEQEKLDT